MNKNKVKEAKEIMTDWIRYEKENKNIINHAEKLIEIQETLMDYIQELEEKNRHLGLTEATLMATRAVWKARYYKVKQKEKILRKIDKYVQSEIECYTEDIRDYIDDDRIGNADIIGEFKEEREHWRDILRIIEGESELYMDWDKYNGGE